MHFFTNPSWLFCFILFSLNGFSQSTFGQIKIQISPSNAIILLDGDTVKNGIHDIVAGEHLIEAWAPTRQLYSKLVTVVPDKQIYVATSLHPSLAYKSASDSFKNQKINYGLKKTGLIVIPSGLTIGVGLAGMSKIASLKDELLRYENLLHHIMEDHATSGNTQRIENFEQDFSTNMNLYNETLEQLNKVERNTIIATSILGAISVYGIIRSFKLKKPVFTYQEETPSFSSLSFGLGIQSHRNLFLTYNF